MKKAVKKALKISLITVIVAFVAFLLLLLSTVFFCPRALSEDDEECWHPNASSTTHSSIDSVSGSTPDPVSDPPLYIDMEKAYTVNVFDTTNRWVTTGIIIETGNKIYLNIDDIRVTRQTNRFELKDSDKANYKYMTTEKLEKGGCLYVR